MAASSAAGDQVARAYARLVGLKENLPQHPHLSERYVHEYHAALEQLQNLGIDVQEFLVPSADIVPIMTSGNYLTGEVKYTRERYVERPLLLAKLTAVLTYFSMGDDGRRQIGFKP